MAKLNNGIFGAFTGKIGPIIGSSWKGIQYIKQAVDRVSKPLTAKQEANLKKFKYLADWLTPFYEFITVGFKNYATRRTEINAAFSENYKAALSGSYPDFVIDYSKVVLSKGKLFGLSDVQAEITAPQRLQLSWDARANLNANFADKLMLVIYNEELGMADGFIGGTRRNEGISEFEFHPKFIGKPLHVYVSVLSPNFKELSTTQYLGRKDPL